MVILEFGEAFKILEIEPTDDKKKIKVAYSKMLKKYHPEDFPEMFMKINGAYEKALEYGGEDFQEEFFGNEEEFEEYEYEGFSNEYNIEITNDEDEEFSNIFSGELEKVEKNVDNWIEAFGKLLNGEKMFFGSLRFLMEEFDSFGKEEKRRIKEILNLENDNYENNVILQSKNITKFEKDYIFLHLIKDLFSMDI